MNPPSPTPFDPKNGDDLPIIITPAAPEEPNHEFAPPTPLNDDATESRLSILESHRLKHYLDEQAQCPTKKSDYQPQRGFLPTPDWKNFAEFLIVTGTLLGLISPVGDRLGIAPSVIASGLVGYGIFQLLWREKTQDLLGDTFQPTYIAYALAPVAVILGLAYIIGLKLVVKKLLAFFG
jgi:hypothetical protein